MHRPELSILHVSGGAGGVCRSILAELPAWFGIPEAVHRVGVGTAMLAAVERSLGDDGARPCNS